MPWLTLLAISSPGDGEISSDIALPLLGWESSDQMAEPGHLLQGEDEFIW
jgi:hypothetical protein